MRGLEPPRGSSPGWRRVEADGGKCPSAGVSERPFVRNPHGCVSGFPGVWARIGHRVAIVAEGDPKAIELYVRRDDAEPFLEDVRGDDEELAGILRLEPVDLKC